MTTAVLTTQSAAGANNKSGLVYITNVSSEYGNIQKFYKQNTVPENKIVDYIITDTRILSIEIEVESINDYIIPSATINGIPVNLQILDAESRKYIGVVENIDYTNETQIIVLASNGTSHISEIQYINEIPIISSLQITSSPLNQTTFKQHDEFIIIGQMSKKGYVRLIDFEASTETEYIATNDDGSFSIRFNISNRNGDLHLKLNGKSYLGTIGNEYISEFTIPVDNEEIQLFNPSIEYPVNQNALRDNQIGIFIVSNYIDFNTNEYLVEYFSADGSIGIYEKSVFANRKNIFSLSNDNLIGNNNITLRITKLANNKIKEVSASVNINNSEAIISLIGNQILDSADGIKIHQYIINSNIKLKSVSLLNDYGNFNINISSISQNNEYSNEFYFNITVTHASKRGQLFLNFEYTTASGEIFSITKELLIAGFDEMIVSFNAWPNRLAFFGVEIYDINKVKVFNCSKNNDITFVNNKNNEIDKYTIVDENENVDIKGKYIYNNDLLNSMSNTTNELKFSISESQE